ncbi:hypothetical protein [Agrobacterium tumefaciens]|uniref:hypothetical protein n=1 Tax=Agrobacterium tumefaciens TaxID=358 RepID=UPI001F255979|nr:hypothetical protein [Agrobacterium tumefaciens]
MTATGSGKGAGVEMNLMDLLDAIGIKLGVLVAGFAGGLLRALSRKSFTVREVFVSPICGALAAAYLTTPVLHYFYKIGWPLPEDPVATTLAAAFLVGTSAMWISDLVFLALGRWVESKRT